MFMPNERLHDTVSVAAPDAPQEPAQGRPLPKRPSIEEQAAASEPRSTRDRTSVPRMMKHPG